VRSVLSALMCACNDINKNSHFDNCQMMTRKGFQYHHFCVYDTVGEPEVTCDIEIWYLAGLA
jgi:hypothetical protein